ncbi:MAG TPA: hypothetical protein ENK14_12595 [Caldithrix sp.]|nr:hypothetical protein [Caldithrix sp.]
MNKFLNHKQGVVLLLLLIALVFSCSKKPVSTLNKYLEAHNQHQVVKALSFFADTAVVEIIEGWTKQGIQKIRRLEEFDSATNSHIRIWDVSTRHDTVYCRMEEANDFYKEAGVEKIQAFLRVAYNEDGLISRLSIRRTPQSYREIKDALVPFAQWAAEKRTKEWAKLFEDGEFRYGYEGAKGWMALLREWKQWLRDRGNDKS